jgi:hypothetical protein
MCALTCVNTIKILKNECIMSVNLSLPFYSLISVRYSIHVQGIFGSSSCSHATDWHSSRPHTIWVFKAYLCMYVRCPSKGIWLQPTQDKQKTQRKSRHTFILWVGFEPIIPVSKEEKMGHTSGILKFWQKLKQIPSSMENTSITT